MALGTYIKHDKQKAALVAVVKRMVDVNEAVCILQEHPDAMRPAGFPNIVELLEYVWDGVRYQDVTLLRCARGRGWSPNK